MIRHPRKSTLFPYPPLSLSPRLFRRYGLPERIRTDNGAPFASNALGQLSTLSVWWGRLGVRPELIEPAHPEREAQHARMHQTLNVHTRLPPRRTPAAQHRRFDC